MMEAQVIKSLLDSYGIPSILESNASPSILNITVDGLGEVRVMARESRAAEARKLIHNGKTPPKDESQEE